MKSFVVMCGLLAGCQWGSRPAPAASENSSTAVTAVAVEKAPQQQSCAGSGKCSQGFKCVQMAERICLKPCSIDTDCSKNEYCQVEQAWPFTGEPVDHVCLPTESRRG